MAKLTNFGEITEDTFKKYLDENKKLREKVDKLSGHNKILTDQLETLKSRLIVLAQQFKVYEEKHHKDNMELLNVAFDIGQEPALTEDELSRLMELASIEAKQRHNEIRVEATKAQNKYKNKLAFYKKKLLELNTDEQFLKERENLLKERAEGFEAIEKVIDRKLERLREAKERQKIKKEKEKMKGSYYENIDESFS